MRGPSFIRFVLALATLPVLASAGCGDGDVERTDPEAPPEAALPSSLDPSLALSSDPVDQINFVLGKAAEVMPGGVEVRYQLRRLTGDSISIDFQQHPVGEDWPPAPARSVGRLGELTAEVSGRTVAFVCEEITCVEFQAVLDSLSFPRLPEGPDGDWFRTLVEEMAGGSANVAGAGGEEAINQRLKDSALHYSETVRTWYQAAFDGEWMLLERWQQTQGFPENLIPGSRRIYLPNLETTAPGVFGCSGQPCILEVESTPLQLVLASVEDAVRFAELFNELAAGG